MSRIQYKKNHSSEQEPEKSQLEWEKISIDGNTKMNELLKLTENDLKLPSKILQESVTEKWHQHDGRVSHISFASPSPPPVPPAPNNNWTTIHKWKECWG